jgi:predicted transcriptional regulator
MPPKRGRNEIIREILGLCQGEGVAKTRIVYQVNLNFRTVNPYIDAMIKGELLEVLGGSQVIYRTTEKGNEALERLKEIDAMIP